MEQPSCLVTEADWRRLATEVRPARPALASRADLAADLLALRGLDLADLFTPTPGDALALRGTSPEGV